MRRILFCVFVLPLAVLFVAFMVGVMVLVLSVTAPGVSAAAIGALVLAAAWFVFARKSSAGAGSESALMGHRSTNEGLL